MSRVTQVIWPVVALVTSFLALFTITRLYGSDEKVTNPPAATSTPALAPMSTTTPTISSPSASSNQTLGANQVVITLGNGPFDASSAAPLFTQQNGQLCIEKRFLPGWRPVQSWFDNSTGSWCRTLTGGPIAIFVERG